MCYPTLYHCRCFGLLYSEALKLAHILIVLSVNVWCDLEIRLVVSAYIPCVQACQLAVVTTPRDSHALCLLGLAQLAQYDNYPNSERSKEAITDASLSFQASIELENKTQSGEPPEQLSSESV